MENFAWLFINAPFLITLNGYHFKEGPGIIAHGFSLPYICDAGGYFFGKLFGRNKLWPVLSKGKT